MITERIIFAVRKVASIVRYRVRVTQQDVSSLFPRTYLSFLAMAASGTPSKDRNLLAVIGDEVCHHLDSSLSWWTFPYHRTPLRDFYWLVLAKSLRINERISLSLNQVRNLFSSNVQLQSAGIFFRDRNS